jgi:SAM-dependent methyltransferase
MYARTIDVYTKSLSTARGSYTVELEMRWKLTHKQFVALYERCLADDRFTDRAIECTLNSINDTASGKSDSGVKYIRSASFKDGQFAGEKFYSKKVKKEEYVRGFINYKIAVSEERPIAKFSTASNALLRFKTRSSAVCGRWRFDFTAVCSYATNEAQGMVPVTRAKMFPKGMTPENYLKTLDYSVVTSYELELEFVAQTPPVPGDFGVVTDLFAMIDPNYNNILAQQEELRAFANAINIPAEHTMTHKTVLNQAKSLVKTAYYNDIFPPTGFFLTIKTDGKRVLVSVNGNRCRLVYGQDSRTILLGDLYKPGLRCMADGEEVGGTIQIFDCVILQDEILADQAFCDRIEHLAAVSEIIGQFTPCIAKTYHKLGMDFGAVIKREWEQKRDFPVDGLIMTTPDRSYRNTLNYKWKPPNKNTTDFVAVECPKDMLGRPPYILYPGHTLHLLFVGIREDIRKELGLGFIENYGRLAASLPRTGAYYQVPFTSFENPQAYLYYHKNELPPIAGKVVELLRTDNDVLGWKFEGLRPDRETGNDFIFAEKNYFNVIDPFTIDHLYSPPSGYFTRDSPTMRLAINRLNRFGFETLLNMFTGVQRMMDLCAGRGGDLFRYITMMIKYALFIDNDAGALTELARRRLDSTTKSKRKGGAADPTDDDIREQILSADISKMMKRDNTNMTTFILEADLKDAAPLEKKVARFGYYAGETDAIFCNMALHYLCDTRESINGVLQFVAKMLRPDGKFAFVVMDGQAVFDKLAPFAPGKTWEKHEGAVLKYAIRKDYSSTKLLEVGQNISVLLPFVDTAGGSVPELRPEPLCNVSYVIKRAEKMGLKCIYNESISTCLPSFRANFTSLFEKLTEDDKEYAAMHRAVCLVKG